MSHPAAAGAPGPTGYPAPPAYSAVAKPPTDATDVLPGVSGLGLALGANPAASPEIRTAISDVVTEFDGLIASFGHVRTRGLAEPPGYDLQQAQQVFDHAWDICQLGS